jgi:glycyl-tRNA synthetase
MAEIEHYVDPKDKSHPRFVDTKEVQLQLLPKDVQERGETTMTHMTVGDAVGQVSHPRICRSSPVLIFLLTENR